VSETLTTSGGEQACILFHLEANPAEAKTLEKEALEVVKHALLETEGDAGTRLDGTLKELNGLIKGLILSDSIDDVHAIISIIDKSGMLHVSHAGRAEAYVVRAGAASQITEYTRGKAVPAFVHIASGLVEARDVVVYGTQRLLRTVTPAQLSQLSQRGDQLLDELIVALEGEKEQAALAVLHVNASRGTISEGVKGKLKKKGPRRRGGEKKIQFSLSGLSAVGGALGGAGQRLMDISWMQGFSERVVSVASDLKNPRRKRRTHLLILASAVAAFILIWAVVQLSTSSQRTQTRAELEQRVEEVEADMRTADNRRLAGDIESANAILMRAEQKAKQVMDNESNLFRMEALDLLDRIRAKREEINNIVRLSPRVVVNIATENPDVLAEGFVGLNDGEFLAYDRKDLYRVLLNAVDKPEELDSEELIQDATDFPRYQTIIFQMEDNSVIEIINEQPASMKTEDPAGWIKGTDIKAYLRYLYVLSPENNQVYKYERLSNRYTTPDEYNVNGDMTGALDMAIDGNVYVLKEGGEVMKLLRGEVKPFVIRHAPEGVLKEASKVFKVFDGSMYFLDPVNARIVVATDGGPTGESSYMKQYILEGDQIGELKDIYVDPDETKLYLIDEKRIYAIDL